MRLFRREKKDEKDSVDRMLKREKKWRVRKIQFLVFLGFFLFVEVVLRIVGFKPGVIANAYYQPGDAVYNPILHADENGITYHDPKGDFYPGQVLNEQGYFSEVNYTVEAMDSLRKLGKKIVLLIGDSYVAGCCPDSYQLSFANLANDPQGYEVLNLGVGGTDPLHYELVVKKFVPLLKPDLVSVVVYLGNDEMPYDRTAKPTIPVCYPVKDGFWFSSEANIDLAQPNEYFKNFDEAKKFYFTYYSLNSDQSSWYEKVIRHSIILSRLYLYGRQKLRRREMGSENLYLPPKKPLFAQKHLKAIQEYCKEQQMKVFFAGIPSPLDIDQHVNLKSRYAHIFGKIPWHTPVGITMDDYDGRESSSHFNRSGHRKYADFLTPLIQKELNK